MAPHLVLVPCGREAEDHLLSLKGTCHMGLQLVGGVDRDFANLTP